MRITFHIKKWTITIRETLNQSTCADWRADFSSEEVEKSQEYFVYFKIFRRSQAEKMPPRRARGLVQSFHGEGNFQKGKAR